jgi:hypothetical protein
MKKHSFVDKKTALVDRREIAIMNSCNARDFNPPESSRPEDRKPWDSAAGTCDFQPGAKGPVIAKELEKC